MHLRLIAALLGLGLLLLDPVAPAPAQSPASLTPLGQVGGTTIAARAAGARAYVGVGPRLEILDVANSDAPVLLGRGPALGEVVQDVAVEGARAYVAEGALDEHGAEYPSASAGGLRVLDISDPSRPTALGFLALAPAPRALVVAAGRAYVATGAGGLAIVDVSDPSQPRRLGGYLGAGSVTYDLAVAGGRAYLADGNALDVVDVSDPTAPRIAARFTARSLGGGYVAPIRGLTLVGNLVYLAEDAINVSMAAFEGGGLRIVDVADPTAPRQVGVFEADVGGIHGRRVAVAGDRAYVSTSIDERFTVGGRLEVFDVSDRSNPRLTGSSPLTDHANGLALVGARVYVAVGSGLTVYDLSTPASPRPLAKRGTPMNAGRTVVSGGRAYVTGGTGGLSVVDVADPSAPRLLGYYEPEEDILDLAVAGSRLYLAEASHLTVVDVTDPTRPTRLSRLGGTAAERAVAAAGTLVYSLGSDQLLVFDAADGANPRQVGALALAGTNMRLAGSRLYAANFESFTSSLFVVDVADPARPTIVDRTVVFDSYDLALADGRVYVAERVPANRRSDLRTLSVCAGWADRLGTASTLDMPGLAQGVAARGGLVLVADESAGLVVVDASEPSRPLRLAEGPRGPGRGVALEGEIAYLGAGPLGLQTLRVSPPVGPPAPRICRTFLPLVPQRAGP